MHHHIIDYAKKLIKLHSISTGHCLEVGSYNVNGTIRDAFQNETCKSYLGVDFAAGPGVDRVIDAHNLLSICDVTNRPDAANQWGKEILYDTVLCCEMLEHDHEFWKTVGIIRTITKVGGVMFVSTPTFGFGEHRFPIDCYRFGRDAYERFIFAGWQILGLEYIPGPNVAGLARKLA